MFAGSVSSSSFSRLGSMREVADELGLTTSTVSHQLATLAREAGAVLVEPDGRKVRDRHPPVGDSPTTPSPSWPQSTRHGATSIPTADPPARYASAVSPPPYAAPCCR